MAAWEPTEPPELVPVVIDDRKYRQIVAELAELFYDWFRQSEESERVSKITAGVIQNTATFNKKERSDGS